MRADLARAIVEDADLEIALSSDCLQDALALLVPLDLILLGHCRGRGGLTCDLATHVNASGTTAVVIIGPDPVLGLGSCAAKLDDPHSALAAHDCSDGEAVRHAIHTATGSARPRQRTPQPSVAPLPARPNLSTQEARALALYSSGLTLDAVADAMYVTPNTAATYLRRVRAKFRAAGSTADSKLELRDLAVAHGLLEGSAL